MRAALALIAAVLLTGLPGCADFPDLDEKIEPAARTAPYPALIPLDQLALETSATPTAETTAASLQDRARALRARAAWLREQSKL